MTAIRIDDEVLMNINDKGIGAKTTGQLFLAGACVIAGDLNDAKGQEDAQHCLGDATYVHVDVSSYDSVYGLFKHALDLHGRVDLAIHCAGITEIGGWFMPGADLESVAKPPTAKAIEVNLLGALYFTHIAVAAMGQGRREKPITLVSSIAGFKESPGLFAYSASKHGVMGLMRSPRGFIIPAFDVPINIICPWATDTEMLNGVREIWTLNSLSINSPDDGARIIVQCAGDKAIHGRAFYVADGKGFDIEEGIDRTEEIWLGERQAKDLAKGQKILGTGSSLTSK